MPNYDIKEKKIEALSENIASCQCVVVGEYRGMTAQEMDLLRKKSREQKVYIKICKNTLAKRALNGTQFECLQDVLKGPVMLALALNEPGDAAKLINSVMKSVDVLKVKGISLGDTVLGPDQLKAIANMPNREQALAMLMGTMQAPLTKLAQTMQQTYSKFAYALNAIKETKS